VVARLLMEEVAVAADVIDAVAVQQGSSSSGSTGYHGRNSNTRQTMPLAYSMAPVESPLGMRLPFTNAFPAARSCRRCPCISERTGRSGNKAVPPPEPRPR
jgi:hypothetical protein